MHKILCDENIPKDLITILRKNFEIVGSIREDHRGISDDQVFKLLNKSYDILITMDKDFGDLIFTQDYQLNNTSIILLREPQYENYIDSIITATNNSKAHQLIIITSQKTRVITT